MERSPGKALRIAYIVVAVLMALSMFSSASFKLIRHPGAVHTINEVVGVPLSLFPVLAALEVAGGLGLLLGIFKPKLGVAAAAGLTLYFICAIIGHVRVGDFAGLSAPIVPFLFAVASLTLRVLGLRRAQGESAAVAR